MIYSITRLFSGKSENRRRGNKDAIIAGTSSVIGAGMLAGSDKLVEKGNQHFASKFRNSTTEGIKDNARIKRELLKQAKSQGIKVVNSPKFENSAYVGSGTGRLIRRGLASGMKWGRKSRDKEFVEGLKDVSKALNDQLGGVSGFGKDQIVMGLGSGNSAVLAHELGHAQHYEGRSKDILGKAAHKLHAPSSMAISILNNTNGGKTGETVKNIGNGILAADGFRRGKNSVYTDEDGKIRINKSKALKSAAVSGLMVAPLLGAEAAASIKGLRAMKKLGASKELLKSARRDLGNAYGTYATVAAKPVMSELGGHGIGVAYGVTREKSKNKKQ